METKNLDQEVNVLDLLVKSYRKSKQNLKLYTIFFFKNIHLFVVSSIMIYGASLLLTKFFFIPSYTSNLVVKTNFISLKECDYVIQALNTNLENQNTDYLKHNGLKETSSDLISVNIDEEKTIIDSSENILHLKVQARSNQRFPLIEKELLYYLENEPFIKTIIHQHLNTVKSEFDEVSSTLKDLQNKSQLNSINKKEIDPNINIAYLDETAIVEQRILLSKKKATLENQLAEPRNFSVISHLINHNTLDISTMSVFKKLFLVLNTILFFVLYPLRNKTKLILS